jgi:hypothetical protein
MVKPGLSASCAEPSLRAHNERSVRARLTLLARQSPNTAGALSSFRYTQELSMT